MADLIHEPKMAVLLVHAMESSLSDQDGCVYYVAPTSGQQGQADLFHLMEWSFVVTAEQITLREFI